MKRFEFGDVLLLPFPFTDQTASKRRPSVVFSSAEYAHERPDVVVMAITSQIRTASKFDTEIADWRGAGLLKPSSIKPLVASIEQSLVLRKLGRLDEGDIARLRDLLASLLG